MVDHRLVRPRAGRGRLRALVVLGALVAWVGLGPGPVRAERARPLAVIDGATVRMEVGGKATLVRLVGVAAPAETACLADGLRRLAAELGPVTLVAEHELPSEANGMLVRYVDLAGEDLGRRVLVDGLAVALRGPYRRQNDYLTAEATARQQGLGLWSPGCTETRRAFLYPGRLPPGEGTYSVSGSDRGSDGECLLCPFTPVEGKAAEEQRQEERRRDQRPKPPPPR